MRDDEQPSTSLWKTLDYLLRRRAYLLAFRRFRAGPRTPEDLSRLIPGLRDMTAGQLVHLLARARLLKRLEPAGLERDSLHTLTAEGERLLGILLPELRRLDASCRASLPRARLDGGRGERCGGAWIVRRLLRERGAMPLLARLPDGVFAGERFKSLVREVPGANASSCLHLLMQCGLIERVRYQRVRLRDYRLTGLGRQTQTLLAILHALADEIADHAVVRPSVLLTEAEPRTA